MYLSKYLNQQMFWLKQISRLTFEFDLNPPYEIINQIYLLNQGFPTFSILCPPRLKNIPMASPPRTHGEGKSKENLKLWNQYFNLCKELEVGQNKGQTKRFLSTMVSLHTRSVLWEKHKSPETWRPPCQPLASP
jgi:hypothetical protein